MTSEPSFNLIDEPWIPVITSTGHKREVSIREVFAESCDLRSITGDLPTQTAAIYRLLEAILHRALPDPDLLGAERWNRLWRAPELPMDQIGRYLDAHLPRFDVLHESTPFFQVAGLTTESGKTSGLKALIADVPNGFQYFTNRSGAALDRISFAEAARWLIHCQGFDPSGIKSGAVGDKRVKRGSGKGYPIGTGWLGGLGIVLTEGRNVRETLLLNFVLAGIAGTPLPDLDLPVWERPPLRAEVEPRPGGEPYGPVDLLTWQSRRIRLFHDGTAVTDALISNGDPLSFQNRHPVEFSTPWRRSEPQEKKLKQAPVYMPRTHAPGRSFWRGLAAILPQAGQTASGRDADQALPPQVLRWLQILRSAGHLDRGFPLRVRAIGVEYGSQSSVISEIIDDIVVLHAEVLADPMLRTHAIDAVQDADEAVKALVNLAGNLVAAGGGESDGARDLAREAAFFSLDSPYRVWVSQLTAATDLAAHRSEWQHTVRAVVRSAARGLVDDAGTPAWVGRTVRDTHIDTSLAIAWFERAINKALPYTITEKSNIQA